MEIYNKMQTKKLANETENQCRSPFTQGERQAYLLFSFAPSLSSLVRRMSPLRRVISSLRRCSSLFPLPLLFLWSFRGPSSFSISSTATSCWGPTTTEGLSSWSEAIGTRVTMEGLCPNTSSMREYQGQVAAVGLVLVPSPVAGYLQF